MDKHYLTVSYDGTVFEYSGTEKEGFEKFENTKGKISYRKYYTGGITGTLKWTEVIKNPHLNNREEIRVVLEEDNIRYYLTFPVIGTNKSVDDMATSLITFLPGLELGSVYKVFPWCIKKGDIINNEEAKRTLSGVSFRQGETKLVAKLTKEKRYADGTFVEGDVPALVYAMKMGKNQPTAASIEARDEFLYNTLIKEIDRLKFPSSNQETKTNQTNVIEPVKEKVQEVFEVEEDNDDLPF